MNELAKITPFLLEGRQYCGIVDNKGKPWFVAKDVAAILEISSYRVSLSKFPKDEVSSVYIIYAGKSGKKIPHKILIINANGLSRLIQNSRKPEAKRIKERFIEIMADIVEKGINRAALPKTWFWGKKGLTWGEWVKKRQEMYFRLHPDKDFDDFLRSLPY